MNRTSCVLGIGDVSLVGYLFSVPLRRGPRFCGQMLFRIMPSLKARRVILEVALPKAVIFYLLPRPKARFTVAYGVRPVGYVAGRIVQATIRELDKQSVTPPFAVKEA